MDSRRRWQISAALIVIALITSGSVAFFRARDPRARLSRAVESGYRTTTMRITGLRHAAPPPHKTQTVQASKTLRLAAGLIQTERAAKPHDRAIAALLIGRASEAIRILEDLVAGNTARAEDWNDLAAAYCAHGDATANPLFHAKALGAVDRAIDLDADLEEAVFNRAVALEKLGLLQQALESYRSYGLSDPDSAWTSEAKSASARIRAQLVVNTWEQAAAHWQRSPDTFNHSELARLTRQFPQQARTAAESQFLTFWADQFIEARPIEAMAWLDASRTVAEALRTTSGEALLRDTVAAINASDEGRKSRLAAAHRIYRDGRLLYRDREVGRALPLLSDAERRFRADGSPMHFMAAYYRANALVNLHRNDQANEILEKLIATAPASYLALHAQLHWLKGTLVVTPGLPYEALIEYRAALHAFEQLGEEQFAARMKGACAAAFADLGQDVMAWRLRTQAFLSASITNNTPLIEVTLNDAARAEVAAKRYDSARSLFRLEVSLRTTNPRLRFDALMWRAFVEAHREGTAPNFDRARVAATAIKDETLRSDALDELQFLQAIVEPDDVAAVRTLSRVIDYRTSKNLRLASTSPLTERAMRYWRLGQEATAVLDLEQAIRITESGGRYVSETTLRDSYFGTAHDASMELARLHLEQGRVATTFAVLDRARSRAIDVRASVLPVAPDIPQIARDVPAATTLVHYTSFEDETLIVSIASSQWSAIRISVARSRLTKLAEQLAVAIARDDTHGARQHGAALYKLLIAPVEPNLTQAQLVVVIPDKVTADIPFAALVAPDGKWLIERFAIAAALSASTFHAERELALTDGLTLISDPAFDQSMFPNLARLPSAAQERSRLRSLFSEITELRGRDATVSAVTDSLAKRRTIHIGAHAFADETDASRSIIMLAPTDGDQGLLDHHRICDLDLSNASLVVLSGCQTATHGGGRGNLSSLGLAFIAGGADSVLGTLSDVDDGAASTLAVDFYRAARATPRATHALRHAQMVAIRRQTPIRDWAGFQVLLGY